MYNDKRYSLTRFSVDRENRALDIRETFSEVLGAVVPVDFRDCFSETAEFNVRGTASVWGAKNTPARWVGADALTAQIAGSENVQAALTVSEVLTSILEATSQTTERTTVQLTISPGAELANQQRVFSCFAGR